MATYEAFKQMKYGKIPGKTGSAAKDKTKLVYNDYAAEKGGQRYPLSLFLKVLTVSLETVKIVKNFQMLEIPPLDKE